MYSAKILGYQFDTVFGLYLPEYVIPSPVVQTDYRQIPGMDGAIDKTEQFGVVRYKTRTWKLQFEKTGKNISSDDLFDLEQDLLNKVHGLSGQIIFDDDPDFYWKGRAFVEKVSCKNNGLLIADIKLITDPYKYSFDNIVVSGDVVSETETYSGTVVTFDASAADSISNISVAISPVQDLHGYDHPWPAGGGANVLDFAQYFTEGETVTQNGVTATFSNGYLKVTGTNTTTTFNIIYKACNVVLPAGTYIMPRNLNIRCNIDGQGNNNYSGAITAESSVQMVSFYVFASSNATVNYNIPMMLVKGTTPPTTYSPYSNICPITGHDTVNVYVSPTTDIEDATVYTKQLGRTVYGGTVDVVEGKMNVTHYFGVYNGSEAWAAPSALYFALWRQPPSISNNDTTQIANWLVGGGDGYQTFGKFRAQTNGAVCIGNGGMYTLAEFKAKLAETPLQVCYELATPITIDLTPTEIRSLLGTNNIWADAGDVTAIVQSMYVFNLQNNRKPIVPTVTNTENVQLVFTIQGVTYTKSLVPGNRKIVELVLFSGTTNVYAKGSGVVTFEYEDAQL